MKNTNKDSKNAYIRVITIVVTDTLVLTEVQSVHYRVTPRVTRFMGFGKCMVSCVQHYSMVD